MIGTEIKLALAAACIGGAFFAGWTANQWKADSEELARVDLAEEIKAQFRETEGVIAMRLEGTLDRLKANEKLVERQIETIVDRPVYRNVCVDADGLRELETARTGKANPGKPAAQVP